MAQLTSVCVFCGSRPGASPAYAAAATELAEALAKRDIRLVYGGGSVGLMDVVADATLAAGGKVTGIIPSFLREREVGKTDLDDFVEVSDMHTRKRRMFDHADAFVVLPGGLGTLDETLEIITWKQLALHAKPVVLLDIDGCWQPLVKLLEHVVAIGFAGQASLDLYQVATSVDELFERLDAYPDPIDVDRPQHF